MAERVVPVAECIGHDDLECGRRLSKRIVASAEHFNTFTKYLENMLKLQLRPLVGALLSLVLYTLLSWQVLPGIKIENVGSYFLIAFLSGFSERYFLQLVKTDPESSSVQINVKERPGN